jgi:hypothetical protein
MDRYTKAVLTMIALSLVTIAVENAIKPSMAQNDNGQTILCGAGVNPNCAKLIEYGFGSGTNHALPVIVVK